MQHNTKIRHNCVLFFIISSILLILGIIPVSCTRPLLLTPATITPPATTSSPNTTSPTTLTSSSLEVPITVHGASNLGGLQLELSFDAQIINLNGVKAGPLASNALVDFNSHSPGQVRIALVASSAVSGNGDIMILTFVPTGTVGSTTLLVEQVDATDMNLHELVVSVEPGQFDGTGIDTKAPLLIFLK